MRFATWNCCNDIHRKLPALLEFGPDVAVVCEVDGRRPTGPQLNDWCAERGHHSKGVAIASFGSTTLTRLAQPPDSGQLSIAAETSEGTGVLAIWSVPQRPRRYIDEVEATIETHAEWLRQTPSIVAGDFNVQLGRGRDAHSGRVRALVERLRDLGYQSAHHWDQDLATFGDFAPATYYHQWNHDRSWHIDYVFVHEALGPPTSVDCGGFDEWVRSPAGTPIHSDHLPVIVDLPA